MRTASRQRRPHTTCRRGLTTLELLFTLSIALLVLTALAMFSSTAGKMFVRCTEGIQGQQQVEKAIVNLGRDIRAAQNVTAGTSLSASPPTLVLQLPAYDANGNLSVPVAAGHTVTYTCSSDNKALTRTENGGTTNVATAKNYGTIHLAITAIGADSDSNGVIDPTEYTALTSTIRLDSQYTSTKTVNDLTYSASEKVVLRNH